MTRWIYSAGPTPSRLVRQLRPQLLSHRQRLPTLSLSLFLRRCPPTRLITPSARPHLPTLPRPQCPPFCTSRWRQFSRTSLRHSSLAVGLLLSSTCPHAQTDRCTLLFPQFLSSTANTSRSFSFAESTRTGATPQRRSPPSALSLTRPRPIKFSRPSKTASSSRGANTPGQASTGLGFLWAWREPSPSGSPLAAHFLGASLTRRSRASLVSPSRRRGRESLELQRRISLGSKESPKRQ